MKKEEGKMNLLILVMIPVLIGIGFLTGYMVFSENSKIEKDFSNNDFNMNVIEEKDEISEIKKIDGIFILDLDEPNDSPSYVFHLDGRVSCEGNYVSKGTYTIDDNKIKIKYNTISGPDIDGEEKTDGEEELKLIDENTIEGYIKVNIKDNIVGKWICGDAYDSDNNIVPLREIFGSIVGQYGAGDITFNGDGTYTNYIGAFSSEFDDDTEGTYDISGNEIELKAKSGKTETIEYYSMEMMCYKYDNYTIWLEKNGSFVNNDDSTSNVDTTNNTTEDSIENDNLNNHEIKGTIEIPSTNINAPIYEAVTTNSMKKGFCIAYGPGLNEVGNTVLYVQKTMLYENNNNIKNGDKIIIKDQSERKNIYEVYDIQDINYIDTSYMVRNTDGNVEISIQTTTDSKDMRRVIFAKKID